MAVGPDLQPVLLGRLLTMPEDASSAMPWPDEFHYVPGSFRDRSGRVFQANGQIYRAVTAGALEEFEAVSRMSFFQNGMATRAIVPTCISCRRPTELPGHNSWAAILHHERVPLITWPYEWCFSMLRDAALHQLHLMRDALAENAVLKDATPYNIQFVGMQPTLIDTASVTRLPPGALWDGYRQFCQLFLYPLMMQAWVGLDFQPFLRGRLDGITPEQFRRAMSLRDIFRPGVFKHVILHSRLSTAGSPAVAQAGVSTSLRESGFQKEMIQHNVNGLIRIVERMDWKLPQSAWSEYDRESDPVRNDASAKEQFVREVMAARRWKQAWDIGCNLGRYSRIAADHSDLVVALDSDHLTVDRLYRSLRSEKCPNITPLVYNPADPTPNMGWRCRERTRFADRAEPEMILCLAVIHHLVISANLLLPDLIDWLAEQQAALIIEFVERSDPQVRSLLANREDVFSDYSREEFDRCITRHFRVERTQLLPSGTRTLLFVVPRN